MEYSENAISVYKKLYFTKDETEVSQVHRRVADVIGDTPEFKEEIFKALEEKAIRPNSPVFINAGVYEEPALAACFVSNLEDNLESIFNFDREAGLIYAKGSGVGANYGVLREKGALVNNNGYSSGAFAFMKKLASTAECVVSGGKNRRSAHMAGFTDTHPDLLEFIEIKNGIDQSLRSMNLSITITDDFMNAVLSDADWNLIGVKDKQIKKTLKARFIFDKIINNAYSTGDPGLIFIDRVNKDNGLIDWKKCTISNPCSEQFLLPYGSCNLAHVNLNNCLNNNEGVCSFDFDKLGYYARLLTRFCDNAIDIAGYSTDDYKNMAKQTRNIGVGITGLADIFIKLNIRYGSDEAIDLASKIARLLTKNCIIESSKLAVEKGVFPKYIEHKTNMNNFAMKFFDLENENELEEFSFVESVGLRNSQWTTCAPCGSTAISADCSSGIEPHFAIVYEKHISDSDSIWYFVNKEFETNYKNEVWYDDALKQISMNRGSCQNIDIIPKNIRDIYVTAHDINWKNKIKMVSGLQKGISNSISHTLNLPHDCDKQVIFDIYMESWKQGLKGITVFLDGCLSEQPITFGKSDKKEAKTSNECQMPILYKKELLDCEQAERHKVSWKHSQLYINVSLDEEDQPIEMFVKLPRSAGGNNGDFNPMVYLERSSNWDLISRLISLSLRYGISLNEIISQCDKSKFSMVDAAGIISRILKKYVKDPEEENEDGYTIGSECPSCKQMSYIRDGGCRICYNCNFSACG